MTSLQISSQNRIVTVSTVTSSVTLNDAVDYTITGTTPFSTTGSINIANDDAVIIFPNLKPSVILTSWLSQISIKGAKANSGNAWVAIYDNGSIVYPHSKTGFTPLTVYKEIDFGGDVRNDFIPFEFYNNVSALGEFENNIRSFKLKRGYMATLACNYDGTGYSRVFIAQDADIEVSELQRELKGRISFIRVFPWNRVTKKGCGAFDWNPGNVLNVTWGYDWGAGGSPFPDDVDYVGMHHHEDWPSYNEIGTASSFNTVLGNNEPDNLNDPSQNPIPAGQMEAVMFGENGLTGSWHNIYKGGYRVGSPAMAGDYDFLRAFMDLCQKYNYRIDFIATHRYLMGSGWDYDWFVNWIYDQYHLPVWITEWNYGAEWNGFLEQGPEFFRDQISGIIPILEANPHLERQAFFNVLGDANRMMTNRHEGMRLMPAGEWYRDYSSVTSYTGGEGYVMRWNYWAPSDLTVSFDTHTKDATLTWLNLNGKQTDSTYVERRLPDSSEWEVINRRYLQGNATQIYRSDNLKGISGLVTYRVRNFDSDGRIRMTGEVELSVGGSEGNSKFQYGTMYLTDAKSTLKVDFSQTMESVPCVFVGPMSDNTTYGNTMGLFTSGSITSSGFTFTPLLWGAQPQSVDDYAKTEELPFVAAVKGNYHYGNMDIEVNSVAIRDTTRINFQKAFPEGVTPIVTITPNRVTQTDIPLLSKIWDVDNEGFTCALMYEKGLNRPVARNQQIAYMAVSPGQACIDSENGILVSAGMGERKVYTLSREETFTIASATNAESLDTLYLDNPTVLAQLQTNNSTVGTNLRMGALVSRTIMDSDNESPLTRIIGVRLRRAMDLSGGDRSSAIDNTRSAEEAGWIAFHNTAEYLSTSTSISAPLVFKSINPLQVRVRNNQVNVDGFNDFELYTSQGVRVNSHSPQSSGIYIVRAGGRSAKVMIP